MSALDSHLGLQGISGMRGDPGLPGSPGHLGSIGHPGPSGLIGPKGMYVCELEVGGSVFSSTTDGNYVILECRG